MNKFTFLPLLMMLVVFNSMAQDKAKIAPLSAVLANPTQFDGMTISTMGVLDIGKGEVSSIKQPRLCLDVGSAKNDVILNCIAIQDGSTLEASIRKLPNSPYGNYVHVIGKFDTNSPKPKAYLGVFRSVEALNILPFD